MPTLGVNVDHVATIRQARGIDEPDPIYAALIAEEAGASCITVHLREDRRHIQDRDVILLNQIIKTRLNLEMGLFENVMDVALKVKPFSVCLVPERRKELTTEGGLNVVKYFNEIKEYVDIFKKNNIVVSLFIDPELEQIKASRDAGADFVELHTGRYADAKTPSEKKIELERIKKASQYVLNVGIGLNAGHGLNYRNVVPIAKIKGMNELNIGHSIVARAVITGFKNAVKEMVALIRN
jgi:pyridoxine 5-phosphate synthase